MQRWIALTGWTSLALLVPTVSGSQESPYVGISERRVEIYKGLRGYASVGRHGDSHQPGHHGG